MNAGFAISAYTFDSVRQAVFFCSVPDLSGTYFLLFKEKHALVLSPSILVYDSVQKVDLECH